MARSPSSASACSSSAQLSYSFAAADADYAANLALAAAAACLLLCMHQGLSRFYPTLGSKELALAIVDDQQMHPRPDDLIVIDGELTAGSTLLFYTQQPVHLVNGRINGPWYGSFWPDAPAIFETRRHPCGSSGPAPAASFY